MKSEKSDRKIKNMKILQITILEEYKLYPSYIPVLKLNKIIPFSHVEVFYDLPTAQDKNSIILFKRNNIEYLSESHDQHLKLTSCIAGGRQSPWAYKLKLRWPLAQTETETYPFRWKG